MGRTFLPCIGAPHTREFIRLLGGAAAWPLAARAQQPATIPRIGIIDDSPIWNAFRNGPRDLGYLEGQNIAYFRRTDMRLEEHFESSSTLQRNERVKLAASFWNNVGAGMVIGGVAAAFFLDKPSGVWTKIGIAIAGLVLGWLCYSIASNLLTYLHTAPEVRH